MGKCIASLRKTTVLFTLAPNSGHRQLQIDDSNMDKTIITLHHRLHQFVRMPFEQRNAPGSFQRCMDVILFTVKWQLTLAYLNDIVLFS